MSQQIERSESQLLICRVTGKVPLADSTLPRLSGSSRKVHAKKVMGYAALRSDLRSQKS